MKKLAPLALLVLVGCANPQLTAYKEATHSLVSQAFEQHIDVLKQNANGNLVEVDQELIGLAEENYQLYLELYEY